MAGLLVAIAVAGVLLSVAMPAWNQLIRREREAELIFRGEQYMRAIELYQRRYVGAYPSDLDTLVEDRFLRRLYEDPMSESGEFRAIHRSQVAGLSAPVSEGSGSTDTDLESERDDDDDGSDETDGGTADASTGIRIDFDVRPQGGIVGVVSTSDEQSLRVYNGRRKYNEWAFVYAPTEGPAAALEAEPGGGASPLRPRRGPGGRPTGEDRGRFRLPVGGREP